MTPTLAALSSAQTGSPLGPAVPEPEPQPEKTASPPPETSPQNVLRSLTDRPPAQHPAQAETQTETPAQSGTRNGDQNDDQAGEDLWAETSESPTAITEQPPTELLGAQSVQRPSTPGEWIERLRAEYADSMLPGMLLAFGVLVLMYLMMRRLIRRPRPAVAPAETRIQEIHDRAATNTTLIDRAMTDAEQLARRLAATLDNKADRIDLLIQEADRKLEELNRAIAQVSRHTPVSTHDRPQRPIRSIDPTLMDRARVEQDRVERRPEPAPHEATPRHEPRLAQPTSDDANPVHRRVWALADDGMPPLEIARSLNQPIGQVELILNLRKSG